MTVQSRTADKARLATLGAVLGGTAITAGVVAGNMRGDVAEAVAGLGAAAPLGFAIAYAVLSLLLVPGVLLSVMSGALFGPLLGGALAVVGGLLGSTAAFLIGRRLGREQVERLAGPRMAAVDRRLRRHGITTLIVVRLAPLVPYSVLNYAAGVTGIGRRDYVLGSALGLVPGAFAYAAIGASLHAPWSVEFVGGVVAVLTMVTVGRVLDRRLHRDGS